MKLLQQIEQFTVAQNNTRRYIAEFILENKLEIHKLSINQIAEQIYASKSALVRFGKALGFSGWKSFLNALIEEIRYEQTHYSEIDPNIPFDQSDNYATMIKNIATVQIESIQDTADQIDLVILEQAVTMMKHAVRIVVLGVSPNNLIADIFRRKMATVGKSVEVIQSGENGMTARGLTADDLAIIVSYSGNDGSREPMKFIPVMQQNQVKLIGITSEGGSFLRSQVPTTFLISSRERLYRKISNFSTEESILFILNILYAGFFSKDYLKNYKFKVGNSMALEETRRIRQTNIEE